MFEDFFTDSIKSKGEHFDSGSFKAPHQPVRGLNYVQNHLLQVCLTVNQNPLNEAGLSNDVPGAPRDD